MRCVWRELLFVIGKHKNCRRTWYFHIWCASSDVIWLLFTAETNMKKRRNKNCDNIFSQKFHSCTRNVYVIRMKMDYMYGSVSFDRQMYLKIHVSKKKVNRTECGNRFRAFIHHIKVMCDEASGILSMAMICNNSFLLTFFAIWNN